MRKLPIRVYVAGPLGTGSDRAANVARAMEAGVELLKAGYAPLVPHLTHFIDPHEALGYERWIECDLAWIRAAEFMYFLPGESPGAVRARHFSRDCGIPVVHSIAELDAYTRPAPPAAGSAPADDKVSGRPG
jgi:hypothetical protein